MNKKSKAVRKPAPVFVAGMWVGAVLSLGLLYAAGAAVVSDFESFRSCNSNSTLLTINTCGKPSLNLGDAVLFGLFIASAALAASMMTAAWRLTRRVT